MDLVQIAAAMYVQPISVSAEDVDRSFQVWDGSGGGLVDNGIVVAPAANVTISASGQTYCGVALVGTNGPGRRAGRANGSAPKPDGDANSGVIRFGSEPRSAWIQANAFWEGQNTTGQSGTLQLNINDNNPYNGDPNK